MPTITRLTRKQIADALREAHKEVLADCDQAWLHKEAPWHTYRERRLLAITAKGDRGNTSDCGWFNYKNQRDIDEVLEKSRANGEDIVEVIIDTGVDVAANRQAQDVGNYDPLFYQVTVWSSK